MKIGKSRLDYKRVQAFEALSQIVQESDLKGHIELCALSKLSSAVHASTVSNLTNSGAIVSARSSSIDSNVIGYSPVRDQTYNTIFFMNGYKVTDYNAIKIMYDKIVADAPTVIAKITQVIHNVMRNNGFSTAMALWYHLFNDDSSVRVKANEVWSKLMLSKLSDVSVTNYPIRNANEQMDYHADNLLNILSSYSYIPMHDGSDKYISYRVQPFMWVLCNYIDGVTSVNVANENNTLIAEFSAIESIFVTAMMDAHLRCKYWNNYKAEHHRWSHIYNGIMHFMAENNKLTFTYWLYKNDDFMSVNKSTRRLFTVYKIDPDCVYHLPLDDGKLKLKLPTIITESNKYDLHELFSSCDFLIQLNLLFLNRVSHAEKGLNVQIFNQVKLDKQPWEFTLYYNNHLTDDVIVRSKNVFGKIMYPNEINRSTNFKIENFDIHRYVGMDNYIVVNPPVNYSKSVFKAAPSSQWIRKFIRGDAKVLNYSDSEPKFEREKALNKVLFDFTNMSVLASLVRNDGINYDDLYKRLDLLKSKSDTMKALFENIENAYDLQLYLMTDVSKVIDGYVDCYDPKLALIQHLAQITDLTNIDDVIHQYDLSILSLAIKKINIVENFIDEFQENVKFIHDNVFNNFDMLKSLSPSNEQMHQFVEDFASSFSFNGILARDEFRPFREYFPLVGDETWTRTTSWYENLANVIKLRIQQVESLSQHTATDAINVSRNVDVVLDSLSNIFSILYYPLKAVIKVVWSAIKRMSMKVIDLYDITTPIWNMIFVDRNKIHVARKLQFIEVAGDYYAVIDPAVFGGYSFDMQHIGKARNCSIQVRHAGSDLVDRFEVPIFFQPGMYVNDNSFSQLKTQVSAVERLYDSQRYKSSQYPLGLVPMIKISSEVYKRLKDAGLTYYTNFGILKLLLANIEINENAIIANDADRAYFIGIASMAVTVFAATQAAIAAANAGGLFAGIAASIATFFAVYGINTYKIADILDNRMLSAKIVDDGSANESWLSLIKDIGNGKSFLFVHHDDSVVKTPSQFEKGQWLQYYGLQIGGKVLAASAVTLITSTIARSFFHSIKRKIENKKLIKEYKATLNDPSAYDALSEKSKTALAQVGVGPASHPNFNASLALPTDATPYMVKKALNDTFVPDGNRIFDAKIRQFATQLKSSAISFGKTSLGRIQKMPPAFLSKFGMLAGSSTVLGGYALKAASKAFSSDTSAKIDKGEKYGEGIRVDGNIIHEGQIG